jgi:aspartyl-tRNA(Asn)/glutamyl-tRNA(Gln) amidotransferase subunit A
MIYGKFTSISEYHDALKKGDVTAVEVTEACFEQIEKNSKLNAYITLDRDNALKTAKSVDQKVKDGKGLSLLEGVPVSVKDMFCTKGVRTTAASRMLENFIPPYDATVIKKLKANGAVIVGKTNQDEFAMGSSNETSFFGPALNPWNHSRVPGGSSGGSAASVAARTAFCSLGTDTGGSVRQPAHFCGTVGFKPTYGRISRYGVVAFASSLDQTGFFSLRVEDCFRAAQLLAGKDPYDNTSSSREVPSWVEDSKKFTGDLSGKKIGLVKEYMSSGASKEVLDTCKKAAEALKKRGAEVVEISLPLVQHGVSAYYLVATSEAASNLSRYDGVRYGHRSEAAKDGKLSLSEFYAMNRTEGFGREVKRRILLGNFSLSSGYFDAYYKKACQVRNLIKQDYEKAFKDVDCILAPVAVSTAFKLKENFNDPLQKFLNDYFTVTVNLSGLPGLTVPIEKTDDGLPSGVQLISAQFEESKLFEMGLALEQDFKFYKEAPNV